MWSGIGLQRLLWAEEDDDIMRKSYGVTVNHSNKSYGANLGLLSWWSGEREGLTCGPLT